MSYDFSVDNFNDLFTNKTLTNVDSFAFSYANDCRSCS